MTRVLVAEDEAPLQAAISDLIGGEAGLVLVGVAGDVGVAAELARTTRPDVALVDVRMPGGGGPQATREIRAVSPATRVVALSAYDERANVLEMLRAGAIGYLVKGVAPGEILEAIHRAVRGQASFSAELVAELAGDHSPVGSDERRASENGPGRSEERFRMLLDSAPDGVAIVDASGRIVMVNRRTEALFGYRREQLVGQSIETLLPRRLRERHVAHRSGFFADPSTRPMGVGLELVGVRRDGTEFPVDVSLSAIETDDGRLVTAFVRDVTGPELRRRLDDEHTARQAVLSRLVAAEEDERRRLAAEIHDDSIQVMTAAGMRLQILRRVLVDPEQIRRLDDLEEAIVLSIARLRHLIFELRPVVLDHEGLGAALQMYIDDADGDAETTYELDDGLLSNPSDETRIVLYRIAQEILTNVRKHAGAMNVSVTLGERNGGYCVSVKDDGVGFAHDPEAPRRPGQFGLAAIRERAELAGGWLRVESAEGRGTSVEVWVARAQPVAAESEKQALRS